MSDKLITPAKVLCVIVGISFSLMLVALFLSLAPGDVVFVGAAGVTVTDDISRALAFAIKWVAVGIAVSPMLYGLAKLVIALKS
ncbi:hypothetical protein H4P50_08610 [Escherichia coli]|nr:hypothetical protein H4P50_08610 [Escherichia coli]